jgi:hypothetical protein
MLKTLKIFAKMLYLWYYRLERLVKIKIFMKKVKNYFDFIVGFMIL